jgi:hypothetical protein
MKYAIIVWTPSSTHFDGFQATAQDAENRLDEIVPPAKWETVKRKHLGRYAEAENATQYVDAGAFECEDGVQFDSNKFTRTDGSAT